MSTDSASSSRLTRSKRLRRSPKLRNSAEAEEALAECCVCWEALPGTSIAVLTKERSPNIVQCAAALIGADVSNTIRACRHFFHAECISQVAAAAPARGLACPLCRMTPVSVEVLPDPTEGARQLRRWFTLVDADANGSLDRQELVEVLSAQWPLHESAALAAVQDPITWARFDPDGSGDVTVDEVPAVAEWLRRQFCRPEGPTHAAALDVPPPDIRAHPADWFRYWDEDHSESLERDEVVRALIKTFKLRERGGVARILDLKQAVDALWGLFDDDGNDSIELGEFLRHDGLGEAIIASL